MKKVEKKTTTRSVQTESFVRLYGRTSPEPAVQIQQHDFDYSFLGTEMVSFAAANFGTAIRKIREAFPQTIFDDSLIEPFGADMPAAVVQDSIESNCKLIYWYRRAVSNPKQYQNPNNQIQKVGTGLKDWPPIVNIPD